MLASATFQLSGHPLVFDGEVEFVRLDGTGTVLRVVASLNQAALVGLENVALIDKEVQLPCLHATAEDEEELDENPNSQGEHRHNADA